MTATLCIEKHCSLLHTAYWTAQGFRLASHSNEAQHTLRIIDMAYANDHLYVHSFDMQGYARQMLLHRVEQQLRMPAQIGLGWLSGTTSAESRNASQLSHQFYHSYMTALHPREHCSRMSCLKHHSHTAQCALMHKHPCTRGLLEHWCPAA